MPRTIVQTIGNTPLISLQALQPEGGARILLKNEAVNPTGSMKDRMALAMIEAAERSGQLRPGGTVVEYTGGSTGVSLAFVCASKGYRLFIVTSDAFSLEKRRQMAAFGAQLTVLPSDGGRMDAALTRAMIAEAGRIAAREGAYWTDQLNNTDQLSAYHAMAEEMLNQCEGKRIDAFVQSTGTAASLRGITERLRERGQTTRVVAVEPRESAVLSGGPSGSHRIEGVGAGFIVPLWHEELADEIFPVSTQEAMAMARRLAVTTGIFAGTSTGANLVAALALASRLDPHALIITLMCDSGAKYLSTSLYAEA